MISIESCSISDFAVRDYSTRSEIHTRPRQPRPCGPFDFNQVHPHTRSLPSFVTRSSKALSSLHFLHRQS